MAFASRTISLRLAGVLVLVGTVASAQPLPGPKRFRRPGQPGIAGKAPLPPSLNMPGRPGAPSSVPPTSPSPPPTSPYAGTPPNAVPPGGITPSTGVPASPTGAGELMPGEKAATDCLKLRTGKKYKWDQRGEIDLASLLAWAQSSFCLPIIVPANLRQQKITIFAPNLMTPQEMYRMFLSALNAMGLTVTPQGNPDHPSALVIIEVARARETAIPTIPPGERVPSNDLFVTKVLRLNNLTVEEMLPVLNRIKSQPGDVISAPPSTLVITDVAENIRRMEEVIALLDVPRPGDHIYLLPLKTVPAAEIAQLLQQIFPPKTGGGGANASRGRGPIFAGTPPASGGAAEGGGGPGGAEEVSLILAEERTNALIIVGSPTGYSRILGLVERLDVQGGPMDQGADRVHVYTLANANSEDLSATLSSLGISVSGGRSRSSSSRPGTSAPGGMTAGSAAQLFEGEVKVAADKSTNSLVIVASGKDYLVLRDLIRKLDLPRRQVFLEATILEVSLDKARQLGSAYHFGDTVDVAGKQSLAFGGLEPNSSTNSILFNPLALTGLAAGLRGPAIPGAEQILGLPPGTSVPAFGVFIQALQNDNDVDVISLPHVLTSDNEKATIQVGQNLPFPGSLGGFPALAGLAGQAGGAPGAGMLGGLGFGTSVQRQDVALKLEITPHVNDSDNVRLEVDNEISDVSSPNYNGLGPATDKRTVKTVVVVHDQQPVVLGGLIKDRISETVNKVPLLGDIPIIGYLFKYTDKTVTKQNLLIILTPYIIKDASDLRRIFERKVEERREFLERYAAFGDERNFEPDINLGRRRGLLEEINRTAQEADEEAQELQRAEASMRGHIVEGPVEPAVILPPTPPVPTPVPPPAPPGGPR